MNLPRLAQVRDGAERHEVLNSASAISFQVLFAAVPLALFGLALAGFLSLDRVWRDAADQIRPNVSPAAFTVLDDTVQSVIGGQRWFWLTLGGALAIWRLSAAMRATMGALDRVYEADEDRPLGAWLRISIALSLALTALLAAALAAVYLLPVAVPVDGAVLGALSFVVRWGIALCLLLAGIALTIRYAPAVRQPLAWVTFGSALSVGCWIVTSAAFGFYATQIASYESLFGSLASVFLTLTYLYLSAIAFLAGVEVDALVRERNA